MNGFLGAGVYRRCCVVEHQNRRVRQRGASQRDALTLTARQCVPALADHRVVTVRQGEDELVSLRDARCYLDVGVAGVGAGESDVLLDRRREQKALFEHHVDGGAQRRHLEVTNVGAVEPHGPCPRIVEASHQQSERCLAGTRRADQTDALTGSNCQRDVLQRGGSVGVAERDVVELHLARRIDDRPGINLVGHPRLRVEQLEDSFGSGARLLRGGEDTREDPYRRDDLHHVAGEREEHAEGDVAVEREPTTDTEDAELTQHRQQLQRRRISRVESRRAHPRLIQLERTVHQPGELAVLLSERLHHAHAGHGLVDDAGNGPRQSLVIPARREDAVAKSIRKPGENRNEYRNHQTENR